MEDAIEAAARAMYARYHDDGWEEASDQVRVEYLEAAAAAIEAALPLLAEE